MPRKLKPAMRNKLRRLKEERGMCERKMSEARAATIRDFWRIKLMELDRQIAEIPYG